MSTFTDLQQSLTIDEMTFKTWRVENGISPIDAPYHYMKRMGRNKATCYFVPVGIQPSVMADQMRRQWVVIYRNWENGYVVSIRVQGRD